MTSKSPFLVYQDMFTATECQSIADMVRVEPTVNSDGIPQPVNRYHDEAERKIFPKIQKIIPDLEAHYPNFKYRGTEKMVFQQFPVTNGKIAEEPHCEASVFKRKKWLRINDRALTGLLWLKDYQDAPPFNLRSQVLGAKLEFPLYSFGFQPQRGTLVVYPACERFISLTSAVLVGELQCVRVHICPKDAEGKQTVWMYKPDDFPGDYRTWFSHVV